MSRLSPGPTAAGLEQWPVVAWVAALHLLGLLLSFWVLAPGSHLSWGSAFALFFFIGFWVLLELCIASGLVALTERWANGTRRRGVDGLRALLLAALLTLALASQIKLQLTGSHLAAVDLWFLGTSLRQISGELDGSEVGLGLMLVLIFALATVALYRGFARRRGAPTAMTTRSFLLLTTLSLVGALVPLVRYPEARFMAPSIVPELAGLRAVPAPTPPGVDTGDRELALWGALRRKHLLPANDGGRGPEPAFARFYRESLKITLIESEL